MHAVCINSISVGRTVSIRTARISGASAETRRPNSDISTVDVRLPATRQMSLAAPVHRHVLCYNKLIIVI